jgi:hypothetical protein
MVLLPGKLPRMRSLCRVVLLVCGAIVVGLVALDALLGLGITAAANDPINQNPSFSISKAARKGRLVIRLTPSPATVDWHGQPVTIDEAWVEHRTRRVYTFYIPGLLYRPIERHVPGYYLVVSVREGRQVLRGPDNPLFYRPGASGSLMHVLRRGQELAYDEIEDARAPAFRVVLRASEEDLKEIVLTPAREPSEGEVSP